VIDLACPKFANILVHKQMFWGVRTDGIRLTHQKELEALQPTRRFSASPFHGK